MIPLDIDQLRTFVAIVDTGGFARAGDAVGRTQSAVSMQVKKLEERLGHPLFERDGRSNRLTAEGMRLLPYARRMLRLQAETLLAFTDSVLAGTVTLGVPDDYAPLLPRILGPFSNAHPMAELTVVCEPTSVLVEMMRDRRIDVGLVTYCAAAAGMSARIVRREPLLWIAATGSEPPRDEPVRLAINGTNACEWARQAVGALERAGRTYSYAFQSQNAAAIAEAVIAGLAVSVLPASTVRQGMRVLGAKDGFPALPDCEIAMVVRHDEDRPVIDALAHHIVGGLAERGQAIAA